MKKNILLIGCSFFGILAYSQVTITIEHTPKTGAKIVQYEDTFSTKIDIQTGGSASKTWDFSNLVKNDTSTMYFFNPDWKPSIGNLVPNADLVLEQDKSFTFIKKSTNYLKVIGSAEDTGVGPLEVTSDIDFLIMQFPMTMGTKKVDSGVLYSNKTYIGMSPGMGAPVIDSLEVTAKYRITSEGIGFGTVKLPNNLTVNNTLMIHKIEENYATARIFMTGMWVPLPAAYYSALGINNTIDTSFSHAWWTTEPNYGFPLVEYNFYQGDSKASSVSFINSTVQSTNIFANDANSAVVYPNPSSKYLNYEGLSNTNAAYTIVDLQGKTIQKGNLVNTQLNIENLANGTYTILVLDNGQTINSKITKQ